MTKKEDAFKQILAKGISQKEIDEKYEESANYMTDKGVPKEQIELFALSRLMSHYKRIMFSPSRTFEGIIYGVDRETDYGAQKQFDESVEMWEADREKAIAEGYTDSDGNPLYHGKRKPATGVRKIDLDKDRGKPIYLVARAVEGEHQDADYRRAVMTLKPDKFNESIPLFKTIRFKAIKGTKSTDDLYILNQSQLTNFEVTSDKEVPFIDIAKKYLKEHICPNLKKLVDWHKRHEEDGNRQVIIKGDITDIRITGEGTSNLVTINAAELDIDDKPITCWIPEDFPISFDENAMEVIVVGRTNLKEEDDGLESVFINAVGLWCPEMYRIQRDSEDEIDLSRIETKTVSVPREETHAAKTDEEELDEEVEEVIKKPEPVKPKTVAKPVVKPAPKPEPAKKPVKQEKKEDDLFESDDVGNW